MAKTGASSANKQVRELQVGSDARQRMLEFYRERDEQDARRCAEGDQRGRGSVYALGVASLESDADVFESYQLLRAAGIELSPRDESYVASLPRDWRFVCRIDSEGRVWTASLRQKNMSPW